MTWHVGKNTPITVARQRGISAYRGRARGADPMYARVRRVRIFMAVLPAALDLNRHPRRGALYCANLEPPRHHEPNRREKSSAHGGGRRKHFPVQWPADARWQ